MNRGAEICRELTKAGIRHVVWLPDSETHFLHEAMQKDREIKIVQVCREGEAIAICAGLHLGGKRAALLIENFGLFETGNVLKWAIGLNIPMLLMVGYMMYSTLKDTPQGKVRSNGQPEYTEPFLNAFGVKYHLLTSDADIHRVGDACNEAWSTRRPVALLLSSADGYVPGT